MTKLRNKQGEYRKSYLGKLLVLLVLTMMITGIYTGVLTPKSTETWIMAPIQEITTDDIGDKLDDTRLYVEQAIKEREQLNADNLLVERANQADKDAVAIQNASVREYKLTLEAMEMNNYGALEIFYEVAGERGLLES